MTVFLSDVHARGRNASANAEGLEPVLTFCVPGSSRVPSTLKDNIDVVRWFDMNTGMPGQKAELIGSGIPTPASMAYDSKRNRLVIPMNDWNAVTFVELK